MWRIIRMVCLTGMFLILLTGTVSALTADELYEQQLEASGGDRLPDVLPEETRELLHRLGIDSLQKENFTDIDVSSWWEQLWALLWRQGRGPLGVFGLLLGTVLLCAFSDGMRHTAGSASVSGMFGTVGMLAACSAVLIPLSACITEAAEAMKSTSVFMLSFVPVYAGILLTGGQGVAAASYQSIVLTASELFSALAVYGIVPLTGVSLALGVTGAASPELRLGTVGNFVSKVSGWSLGIIATLFTGLLSLQTLVGTAADTLSARAIKFSLSSFVPVVGGSLGEAFSTVRGCLTLLKSTVGAFGIIAVALLILPPLFSCILWSLSLGVGGMCAEMFGLAPLQAVCKAGQSAIRLLIAALAIGGLFMIVAVTIVTMAGTAA